MPIVIVIEVNTHEDGRVEMLTDALGSVLATIPEESTVKTYDSNEAITIPRLETQYKEMAADLIRGHDYYSESEKPYSEAQRNELHEITSAIATILKWHGHDLPEIPENVNAD